jgi:PAS domain S-box-containing protein
MQRGNVSDYLEQLKVLADKLNNTEFELARSNALLAAIVENAAEAIIGKDLEGYITAWNPAAEHLYGWSEEEAIGRHIYMIIPEDKREEFHQILNRVNHGESLKVHRTTRLHKDGHKLDLIITISPIRTKDGRIVGASSLAHPVSWL